MPTVNDDSKLASLIALLEPSSFPPDAYVDALHETRGDLERAAELLLLSATPAEGSWSSTASVNGAGIRKRKKGLDHWFRAKHPPPATTASTSTPASSSGSSSSPNRRPTRRSPSPELDRLASASQWATLLKPPSPSKLPSASSTTRPPPHRGAALLLTSPSAIASAGLPLALLSSPLSPQMAAALYYEMLAESPEWPRNKWYLAGREVESNHQATTYSRPGGGFGGAKVGVPYYYAARKYDAKPYTPVLAEASRIVEEAVNAHLDTMPRYPLEYRGRWRANMCAANRYDGAQSTVGWHADQMTYLGPYPTIASLSLGTPRAFRLRQIDAVDEAYASTRPTRTYEVNLAHNSLVLMTPGCQERYKHTVPPQRALDTFRPQWDANGGAVVPGEGETYTTRINITFRFYRDDFHPDPATGPRGPRSGTPMCKCGMPTILRADQKAKARSRLGARSSLGGGQRVTRDGTTILDDDMVFFWQCQSPGTTGEIKGCSFFKILDMGGEGRGPCLGDEEEDENENEHEVGPEQDGSVEAARGAQVEEETKVPECEGDAVR